MSSKAKSVLVVVVLVLAVALVVVLASRRGKGERPQPKPQVVTARGAEPAARTFETKAQPLTLTEEQFSSSQTDWSKSAWVRILWSLQSPYGAEIGDAIQWAAKKWFSDQGKASKSITVGTLKLSSAAIGIPKGAPATGYTLWHVSVPLVIEPTWDRLADYSDDFSHVGVQFRLLDNSGKATAQIMDVLPNTRVDPANFGGKATFQMHVGADRKWEAVEGSARGDATFWWNWNPKVLITASGASGNEAFCLLNRKPDKSGWVGAVPVELLVMAPSSATDFRLDVEPFLMFRSKVPMKMAQVIMALYLSQ